MLLELFLSPLAFLFVLRLRSMSGWLVLLTAVLVVFNRLRRQLLSRGRRFWPGLLAV
jgi:hypothetical protein